MTDKPQVEKVVVVPVPVCFLLGVPAIKQRVTPERAAALVASGAFTREPKE